MHLSCTFCKAQCPRDKGKYLGMPLRVKNCNYCFILDKTVGILGNVVKTPSTLNSAPTTMTRPREGPGLFRWSLNHAHRLSLATSVRYKRLNWLGKTVLYFLIIFHILLAAALIHIGPDNLFQHLYDLSQTVRNSTHGWWILALVMSASTSTGANMPASVS